jgi:hypothetical protein
LPGEACCRNDIEYWPAGTVLAVPDTASFMVTAAVVGLTMTAAGAGLLTVVDTFALVLVRKQNWLLPEPGPRATMVLALAVRLPRFEHPVAAALWLRLL